MKKDEYPKAIADLLGLAPVQGIGGPWMSSNGTVLSVWVDAVAETLNVPRGSKVETMQRLVESVGGTWDRVTMASTHTASGGGGNISLPAFAALYNALQKNPSARRTQEINLRSPRFQPAEPPDAEDDRWTLRAIRTRRGQPQFRAQLLTSYGYRCAFSTCDVPAVLEAAHIEPYGLGGTYETSNGLLLRADLHTLFDLCLLTVDAASGSLLLHPGLAGSSVARELAGRRMRRPSSGQAPSPVALRRHRSRCEF